MVQLLQWAPSEFCRIFLNSSPDLSGLVFPAGCADSGWLGGLTLKKTLESDENSCDFQMLLMFIFFFFFIKALPIVFCSVH